MKSKVLSQFSYTILPTVGLLIFIAVIVGVYFWLFRKGSKSFYKELSEIPFKKEEL
jgi:cbb3-type cytochrome oxidase subunit 3